MPYELQRRCNLLRQLLDKYMYCQLNAGSEEINSLRLPNI
jgi:hypothetical protein